MHGMHFTRIALLFLTAGVLGAAGCGGKEQESAMSLKLESSAFQHGQPIPVDYTGDGRDVSPPLSWSGVPEGTAEFALICDDPDAPSAEPWVHWLIYKIPGSARSLPEGIPGQARVQDPRDAMQGRNSWTSGSTMGYRGPAPPEGSGAHHYHFRLYALDAPINLRAGMDKKALLNAMRGHILAEGELIGTYER
jgi:hypothetical protein